MKEVYRADGSVVTMTDEEYNKKILNGEPVQKPKVDPPAGYEILTWSNVGDLLEKAVTMIRRLPKEYNPTPEQIGVDNTIIGPDGVTNYIWLMREANRIIGYAPVKEGDPV